MKLRAAQPSDLSSMFRLGQICELKWTEKHLQFQLEASYATLVVAVSGDLVVGALSAQLLADEAELLDLGVLPAFRRQGLAKLLMQHLIVTARTRQCTRVWLEVAGDNGPAQSLYVRLGFRQKGLRPAYYARQGGALMDALVLVLDLTSQELP